MASINLKNQKRIRKTKSTARKIVSGVIRIRKRKSKESKEYEREIKVIVIYMK